MEKRKPQEQINIDGSVDRLPSADQIKLDLVIRLTEIGEVKIKHSYPVISEMIPADRVLELLQKAGQSERVRQYIEKHCGEQTKHDL